MRVRPAWPLRWSLRLALCAALVPAPSRASPAREGCAPSLSGREYGDCLRRAEPEAAKALSAAVENARAAIERAPGPPPGRARWRRLFDESQANWLRHRTGECQDLAPFEAVNKARVFEEQVACRIDRDAARAADLRARYGTEAPRPAAEAAGNPTEPGVKGGPAPAGGKAADGGGGAVNSGAAPSDGRGRGTKPGA